MNDEALSSDGGRFFDLSSEVSVNPAGCALPLVRCLAHGYH
jgi:hypothetical protein